MAKFERRDGAKRNRLAPPGRGEMRIVYDRAVVHESFSFKARMLQRFIRLIFKPILRWTPLNDRTLRWMRVINRLSARRTPSRHVITERLMLGGVVAESMKHRHAPESDMTIMYLHGGGFISCGIDTHRRICERLARKTGATVYSIDYVQLPDGAIADSVQDAIAAYEALAEVAPDPDKIVVGGDSAGGYLTFKVAELATLRGLPAPAALIGFSPLVSVDPEREDKGVVRIIRERDAYLPAHRVSVIRQHWLPEGSMIEGQTSPLDAIEQITSPTFLVAVEDEMLRPEVEAMALLLSEQGVSVETHLWRKQIHAFPVLGKALPEAEMALQLASDFARRAVGELDTTSTVDPNSHGVRLIGEIEPDAAT